jgi:hypothetical protein
MAIPRRNPARRAASRWAVWIRPSARAGLSTAAEEFLPSPKALTVGFYTEGSVKVPQIHD